MSSRPWGTIVAVPVEIPEPDLAQAALARVDQEIVRDDAQEPRRALAIDRDRALCLEPSLRRESGFGQRCDSTRHRCWREIERRRRHWARGEVVAHARLRASSPWPRATSPSRMIRSPSMRTGASIESMISRPTTTLRRHDLALRGELAALARAAQGKDRRARRPAPRRAKLCQDAWRWRRPCAVRSTSSSAPDERVEARAPAADCPRPDRSMRRSSTPRPPTEDRAPPCRTARRRRTPA